MQKLCHKNVGFSLIEMSVVLVIISTILGSMMVLTNKSQDKAKYDATIAKIKAIDAQAQQYAIKGGAIPCPAARNSAPNTATFGVATVCTAAAVAGETTDVGQVRIGVVPTRTLGLPDDYGVDSWGMRITYAVNKNLADTPAAFSGYVKTAGGITVQDSAGNNLVDGNITLTKLIPAYVIISHGVNKKSATVQAGTSTNPCGGGTMDAQNCGNTGVFVDTSIKLINKTSGNYFDDVIIWRTYDFLDNNNDNTSELN